MFKAQNYCQGGPLFVDAHKFRQNVAEVCRVGILAMAWLQHRNLLSDAGGSIPSTSAFNWAVNYYAISLS